MSRVNFDAELRVAERFEHEGRASNAEAICRRLLEADPSYGPALHLLARLAMRQGRLRPARRLLELAIRTSPDDPAIRNSYGATLATQGDLSLGLSQFRLAVQFRPGFFDAELNLATALARMGDLPAAVGACERAIAIQPSARAAWELVLATYTEWGDAENIVHTLKRAVALSGWSDLESELLYSLHYLPGVAASDLFDVHSNWGHRRARLSEKPHAHSVDTKRRLQIGYVSAGFRAHPVARFQLAELEAGRRSGIAVTCYSASEEVDSCTDRLRAAADRWRCIAKYDDDEAAELIRNDRIDILVDLDGHSTGNRLGIFARKPAPVQATYNGYVNTTGLPQMDWRITDALHDPPGMTERWHTERLWRLPECNWCYTPDEGLEAATKRRSDEATKGIQGEAPAKANDSSAPSVAASLRRSVASVPTFGSLNKFIKASDPCLRLWAKLMARVPEARLLVAVPGDPSINRFPLQRMIDHGIPADRVTVVGRSRTRLDRFGEIDIHLDTFPFNGITTTCDGLWQGVPTVTLEGNAFHNRSGVSLMTNIALPELIAKSEDEYVQIAANLANDRPRLTEIRRTLRPRMAASPLCDGPRLARALEEAYRGMWVDWCERRGR